MDLNIAEAANDPTIGIATKDEPVVTTNVDDEDETVTIDAPPVDPEEPVFIPFSQVDEDSVPIEQVVIEEGSDGEVVEQTFAPGDAGARTRLSNMVVQLSSSLRLRVAETGMALENVYSERKEKIQDSEDLDDRAKHLSMAILDQAYAAASKQDPVDKEDKQTMGALTALAHGLIKASDAAKARGSLSKVPKERKSKKTQATRKKNKVARQTRKKQRKKK